MSPITSAAIGPTNPDAGVIATSPTTGPEIAPRVVGCPLRNHSAPIHPKTAAAVAKCVATKALVASPPEPNALPALKPNQPTHRRHAPITLRTTLCGGIACLG